MRRRQALKLSGIMGSIGSNLQEVRQRLATACALSGRSAKSVTLMAVGKTFGQGDLRAAYAAGQRVFGENYVQEALAKIEGLADLRGQIEWHLIGPLQANKTRLVAEQFDWVHTVDRLRIAERLALQRPPNLPPLHVCLQVNISGEASKAGLAAAELAGIAHAVAALPRLTLRGLMAIPEPALDPAAQRAPHRALHEMMSALQAQGLALDTLSMGMSDDLESAVAEGSTCVRVGRAIFGQRTARGAD
jgi:pyridoxal phosphate enzyme (YggS family)